MSNDIYFSCCPVRASEINPDGSPALIDECPLAEAQWIGVYRHNPDHEDTGRMPTEWLFDIPVEAHAPDYALKIGHGLVELLNGISAQDALHNPNLHIFFE